MAVLDAPAGEADLDGVVGLVVVVAVGDEEKIGRRAEPESVEADGDGGGERDFVEEDGALIHLPVAVGVFEDDDAAVAGAGKAGAAGFVVAVLGDPETAAVVPAERNGLSDHGLGGGEFDLEAGGGRHLGDGLFAGEENGFFALVAGDAPHGAVHGFAAEVAPSLVEFQVVKIAGVDDELVAEGGGFALGDFPVAEDGAARADAELVIDAPRRGIAVVFRMIENGDVGLVVATVELEADVGPDGALAVGAGVALAGVVDDGGFHAGAPRHAKEEAAVGVFADGEIDEGLAGPLEFEDVALDFVVERPELGLGHDRFAGLVEEVVGGGPFNLRALRDDGGAGDAAPVTVAGVVEIVAAVEAGETPVEAGLVFVMAGAELGEDAFAVGGFDRVDVGPEIGAGVLREDGLLFAGAEDGDGFGDGVFAEGELDGEGGGDGAAGGDAKQGKEAERTHGETHGRGVAGRDDHSSSGGRRHESWRKKNEFFHRRPRGATRTATAD